MALNYRIWDFPSLQVSSQLFYAPGAGFDGGFTSGGASIFSPEPGGRSFLEFEMSLQIDEWTAPFASWIMSKTNGDIFRVQLTKTPQLVSNVALGMADFAGGVPWSTQGQYEQGPWDNGLNWSSDDVFMLASASGLDGETTLVVDTALFGPVLHYGHVIGHGDYAYMIDDIEYNGTIATLTVKPPLRKNVNVQDFIYLRPFFLGRITNGSEIRALYEAGNVGYIQPSRIVFSEVIV